MAISAAELNAIRDRWQPRTSVWHAWPRYVGYAAVAVTTLLFAMLVLEWHPPKNGSTKNRCTQ